jgi:hypothetical protein
MVCDLCNAEGEGTYVNSTLLKVAVANGFNPVTRAPYLASRPDGVSNWRAMVTLDDSDWNLCAACMNAIRPYAVLRPTADVTPVPTPAPGATPKKKSSDLGCFVVLLIIVAIVGGAAYIRSHPATPAAVATASATSTKTVVQSFYDDISAKRYSDAYALLAPAWRAQQTYNEFVAHYSNTDRMFVDLSDTSDPSVVHTHITETTPGGTSNTYDGTVSLIYDTAAAQWLIAGRDVHKVRP